MRVTVALEFVVQIGVRINVQNGQALVMTPNGSHDRICDRVIAAECNREPAVGEHTLDRSIDRR